jgi:hypothetical protein
VQEDFGIAAADGSDSPIMVAHVKDDVIDVRPR